MDKMLNVAFCASEVFPFAKTGGLADVCGALPKVLAGKKLKITVFVPYYRCVKKGGFKLKKISDRFLKGSLDGQADVVFVRNDTLFDRSELYGDASGDYPDNLKRFRYFCQQVLRYIEDHQLNIDIIHCHDWQTALIPVYLKELYAGKKVFQPTKTVLTIHNLAFQGVFPAEQYSETQLPDHLLNPEVFEFYGKTNLLKAGIVYADKITTVSPSYAKEIQTESKGCGLHPVLQKRKKDLSGILNGIDEEVWNPKTDTYITARYSLKNMKAAKADNKAALLRRVGWKDADVPVFGNVGRISHQKGFEVILKALEEILKLDCRMIIQGLGDPAYIESLKTYTAKHPDKLSVRDEFDEHLAHQVYAGSDFFLMPSEFEPCGLSQLISFRYGTVPVVHKTGGLADTVKHKRTGVVFKPLNQASLVRAVKQALRIYKQVSEFNALRKNAMKQTFSWPASARKYKEIYTCLLSA